MMYSFNNDVLFYSVPGHLPKHQQKVCWVNSLGFLHLRLGLHLGTLLAAQILALVVARTACSLALGPLLDGLGGLLLVVTRWIRVFGALDGVLAVIKVEIAPVMHQGWDTEGCLTITPNFCPAWFKFDSRSYIEIIPSVSCCCSRFLIHFQSWYGAANSFRDISPLVYYFHSLCDGQLHMISPPLFIVFILIVGVGHRLERTNQ